MHLRVLPVALIGAVLLTVGAIAAACGGDGDGGGGDGGGGELTLEEYFQRVEELDDELQADEAALDEQMEQDLASVTDEQDALDLVRDGFEAQLANVEDFVDDLDSLDPPAEVEDAHNEAVAAQRDFLVLFRDILDQLGDSDSFDAVDALFGTDEFAAAEERATQSCLAVEQIGVSNGFDVDFDCGDE